MGPQNVKKFWALGPWGAPIFFTWHLSGPPACASVGSGAGDKTNMQAAKNELTAIEDGHWVLRAKWPFIWLHYVWLMRRVTRIGDLVYWWMLVPACTLSVYMYALNNHIILKSRISMPKSALESGNFAEILIEILHDFSLNPEILHEILKSSLQQNPKISKSRAQFF